MSPTIFRVKGYRFFFFSHEEPRIHVHVHAATGEAKFWLEPKIELAQNYGMKDKEIREAQKLIEEHGNEIRSAWKKHFSS